MTTDQHVSMRERAEILSLSAVLLTALTIVSSVIPCIELPNLEIALFDLPILLCLIWHRPSFAVANWVLGATVGFLFWGSQDVIAWLAIYLNTLLFVGFILLTKRNFRQLGLSIVGISYWLIIGTPISFILFALQYADNDVAVIAVGQRLFSGLVAITLAIAAHFTVVLIQNRLPSFVFGHGRRFTVRMREIAETAALMAAALPMLFFLWALVDRETESEIAALFAASDARFESLALSANANLVGQRELLQSLRSLADGINFQERHSTSEFDQQLLATINASDAMGFVLRADNESPLYLSNSMAQIGLREGELATALTKQTDAGALALTDDEQGLTGYLLSANDPTLMLIYETPLALWDALYGSDMLGLMSGLNDAGMIDRVSHFHGPSAQELYGISDEAVIVREEYDYAIWIPPVRFVDIEKPFKRLEKLSKSYITFQASDELIASFDSELYDVDCFRYTVDLWSHIKDALLNASFLIFGAAWVLLIMAGLIEFAVGRFSRPFAQLADAMENFSETRPGEPNASFEFDLKTGTKLFRNLALGFNRMEVAVHESTERLAQLNSSYESLLSEASIGFIALNDDGEIDYINPTASELLAAIEDLPERVDAGAVSFNDVVSIDISNQKTTINLLATQAPRTNLTGATEGKWLIVYDVSSLRSTERKLLEAQRLSTLGELTMGMSHEISQPLQAMTLTVANLKRSLRDNIVEQPALGEKLTRIDGNIHKIANLIKFMQTYGGIGSTTREVFNPNKCIEEAVARHNNSQRSRLSVSIENTALPDSSLMGDPEQFELVIHHIVKNAADAAAAFADEDRVLNIACETTDGRMRIRMTDNCGGISETAINYVFDPFFTTKDPDKGMGLGLSVSHGIITAMGGELAVVNSADGASFTISVPVANT